MRRQDPWIACRWKCAEPLPRLCAVNGLPEDAKAAEQDGRVARPDLETPESRSIGEVFRSPRRASIRALEELVAASQIHR